MKFTMTSLAGGLLLGATALATGTIAMPASATVGSCDDPITFGTTISSTGRY